MQAAKLAAVTILKEPGAKSRPHMTVYFVPEGSVYVVPSAPGQSEVVASAAALEDVDEAIICDSEGNDDVMSGIEVDMSIMELVVER